MRLGEDNHHHAADTAHGLREAARVGDAGAKPANGPRSESQAGLSLLGE